jgi:hypothetical protein
VELVELHRKETGELIQDTENKENIRKRNLAGCCWSETLSSKGGTRGVASRLCQPRVEPVELHLKETGELTQDTKTKKTSANEIPRAAAGARLCQPTVEPVGLHLQETGELTQDTKKSE